MHNVSIATALQIALDALPDGDLGIGESGLPIAVSNAEKLDYVVENDGILITSRLKALTYKETRVYNVKHLKDLKPEQLAAVIKQSVRPWSWRSRIDDLGEQLRTGGPRIPAKAVDRLFKSGVQLASAESPLGELTAGAEATATDAPSDKSSAKPTYSGQRREHRDSDSLTAQEAVQLGDALVNGLVTFMHASITTVEIMHLCRSADRHDPIGFRQADHHTIASGPPRNRRAAERNWPKRCSARAGRFSQAKGGFPIRGRSCGFKLATDETRVETWIFSSFVGKSLRPLAYDLQLLIHTTRL